MCARGEAIESGIDCKAHTRFDLLLASVDLAQCQSRFANGNQRVNERFRRTGALGQCDRPLAHENRGGGVARGAAETGQRTVGHRQLRSCRKLLHQGDGRLGFAFVVNDPGLSPEQIGEMATILPFFARVTERIPDLQRRFARGQRLFDLRGEIAGV